ncbi:MAG: RluA family pseudouridine synthase [Fimbriiglobus sp.]
MHRLPAVKTETTLLPWLLEVMAPMSRSKVKAALTAGRVYVNGAVVTQHNHALKPKDRVTVASVESMLPEEPSLLGDLRIVHEDDALIVVDKPSGLLSVATEGERTDTAYSRLRAERERLHKPAPHILHRLDRETSGLLLFATKPEYKIDIQETWEQVEKRYLAVVCGAPPHNEGVVTTYLREMPNLRIRICSAEAEDGKWAQTKYKVLARAKEWTALEVELVTGRKHQIRVHLASLGCHVIGDTMYESPLNPAGRLGLHAAKIRITHPRNKSRLTFESPWPLALKRLFPESTPTG